MGKSPCVCVCMFVCDVCLCVCLCSTVCRVWEDVRAVRLRVCHMPDRVLLLELRQESVCVCVPLKNILGGCEIDFLQI